MASIKLYFPPAHLRKARVFLGLMIIFMGMLAHKFRVCLGLVHNITGIIVSSESL